MCGDRVVLCACVCMCVCLFVCVVFVQYYGGVSVGDYDFYNFLTRARSKLLIRDWPVTEQRDE